MARVVRILLLTTLIFGFGCKKSSVNLTLLDDGGDSNSDEISKPFCSDLSLGQICTVAGMLELGNGKYPATQNEKIFISPIALVHDEYNNLYIADNSANVIYYWNRSSGVITKHGVSISAGQLKVVAGNGSLTTWQDGPALSASVNNPSGLAYNASNSTLYIALASNFIVVAVDGSGQAARVFGGGASHTDGVSGLSHQCSYPRNMAVWTHATHGESLYITCNTSHRLKLLKISDGAGYTIAGNGTTSYTNNITYSSSTGLPSPYGLHINSKGIYLTSSGTHKVIFLNHSGSAQSFWGGAVNVATNVQYTIIGNSNSTPSPINIENQTPTSFALPSPYNVIEIDDVIFFTDGSSSGLFAANNTGAQIVIGTDTIDNGKASRVNSNSFGYNGPNSAIQSSKFNYPYQLTHNVSRDSLLIADYGNNLVREFDLTQDAVSVAVGSGGDRYGTLGDWPQSALAQKLNFPSGLYFDSTEGNLFFVDNNNYRIRVISSKGEIFSLIGSGSTSTAPTFENVLPGLAQMGTMYNSTYPLGAITPLFGTSTFSLAFANSSTHVIRAWSPQVSDTFHGVGISSNRVSTVAGDGLSGNVTSGSALQSAFNRPSGILYDSTTGKTFISDSLNDCIKSIDGTGNLAVEVGICGSGGNGANTSTSPISLNINNPQKIVFDENNNMYIADRDNLKIRFWNRSALAINLGTRMAQPNEVITVACDSGTVGSTAEGIDALTSRCDFIHSVVVIPELNQVCYNSGSLIRCIDRSTWLVTTVAGVKGATYPISGGPFDSSQEGVLATNAFLNMPADITWDGTGIIISDQLNHLIRKVRLK